MQTSVLTYLVELCGPEAVDGPGGLDVPPAAALPPLPVQAAGVRPVLANIQVNFLKPNKVTHPELAHLSEDEQVEVVVVLGGWVPVVAAPSFRLHRQGAAHQHQEAPHVCNGGHLTLGYFGSSMLHITVSGVSVEQW